MTSRELYARLKPIASDPVTLQEWLWKWYEDGQNDPGMTWRALSYHVSRVMEGYEEDPEEDGWMSDYLNTKYGWFIYDIIGGGRFSNWTKTEWPWEVK